MKRVLIAGALALAAGGQALAADLPQAAPPPPPPRAPAAYIPQSVPTYNWGGVYLGINGGYGFGTITPSGAVSTSFSTDGYLVGGTLGANFQAGAFVLGVEGDFDYSTVKGSPCTNCEVKSEWLGTGRGRIGFAADRVLVFATGGGAFANVEATQPGKSASTTAIGWTGGGGVEVALAQNWTAKAEYLYIDFPSPSFSAGNSFKFTESLIRAGVNFKF